MFARWFMLYAAIGVGFSFPAIGWAAEPADWIGVKVLPKERCVIMGGDQPLDKALFEIPYVVQRVHRNWLLVGYEKKGWVHKDEIVTLDDACAYYTELIKKNKKNAWAYSLRAAALKEQGELDLAIADFGERIRLEPDKTAYINRGLAWESKKEFDKAIADYGEAIRLDPKDPASYCNRGLAAEAKKDYAKAIADYELALRIDPNSANAYNSLAWVLATCPVDSFRNGKRAVELAGKACELTKWKVPLVIDTLAAATAEVGEFDNAIKFENKAIEVDPKNASFVKGAKERIQLYSEHKPLRK